MNDQNTPQNTNEDTTPWLAKMLSYLIDPDAPQNTNEEIIPDTINGMAVWKLDGVRLTNRELIMRSDAWIHFSDHGDDGWGLMAPEVQINSWREDLSKAGITITPWENLPYKPYGKTFALVVIWIALISFVLIIPFFFVVLTIIIVGKRNQYTCRHIRFAPGLRGVFAWTSLNDTHVHPNSGGYQPSSFRE
jgi:hypothetical protein